MKNFATVLVICAAGLLGWYMPTLQQADAGSLCQVHQVDECPFCNPELKASEGMCQEHTVKGEPVEEAVCIFCNPELKKAFVLEKDWCKGHSVPESQCTTCLIHGH